MSTYTAALAWSFVLVPLYGLETCNPTLLFPINSISPFMASSYLGEKGTRF